MVVIMIDVNNGGNDVSDDDDIDRDDQLVL